MQEKHMAFEYSEKNYSVLVADDNQNNLKILGSMLESLGYRVRVAKSGDQTIQSVQSLKPDIILLDIHMPGMDGYEVCRQLKENKEYSDIPVIFISALSEVFNKIQAFRAGGIDYITKPFELEEVRLRIETHIRLKENGRVLQKALTDLQNREAMLIQSEKLAALGILTSGVAHEINNPVNYISNSISALEEQIRLVVSEQKIPDEGMMRDFNRIFSSVSTGIEQITRIVHSLRIYSGIDADLKNNRDLNNLNHLIDSILVIMNHRFTDIITIEKNYAAVPHVECQAGRISLAIINIILNSIDAIQDAVISGILQTGEGKITVSTGNDNEKYSITISDNGAGIDESAIGRIFDPFFSTKNAGHGAGLGLSICQSIIKDHNGSIYVESTNEKGTTTVITLPLTGA